MKSVALTVALLLAAIALAAAALTSDQSFVVVGNAAIERSLAETPSLLPPVLMELAAHSREASAVVTDAEAEAELEALAHPALEAENALIASNVAALTNVELLAHELGAPVYSEMAAEKSDHLASSIEHSLLAHEQHTRSNLELLHENEHLLESAPTTDASDSMHFVMEPMSALEQQASALNGELAMVELDSAVQARADPASPASSSNPSAVISSAAGGISAPVVGSRQPSAAVLARRAAHLARSKLPHANDYAFLDDPKTGGQPTVLKNLKGLDIYVVNTQVQDNDNEIRPVKPPHPMSAAMREKARLAAIMRAQLVHDIPQPKAAIRPRTRINTLSAYESSLVDSRPLRRMSSSAQRALRNPMVGGQGAMQLMGARRRRRSSSSSSDAGSARFQQLGMESELPGTGGRGGMGPNPATLPHFPMDPLAKPLAARAYGAGQSFDNRDGPPQLLDDLLPIKAILVEDLTPDQPKQESVPNGW